MLTVLRQRSQVVSIKVLHFIMQLKHELKSATRLRQQEKVKRLTRKIELKTPHKNLEEKKLSLIDTKHCGSNYWNLIVLWNRLHRGNYCPQTYFEKILQWRTFKLSMLPPNLKKRDSITGLVMLAQPQEWTIIF